MTDERHPVQQLYARLEHFGNYPPDVTGVWEHLDRTGFFPGNPGLWNVTPGRPLPRWPLNGVLIVGHNYDSEASFRRALAAAATAAPPAPGSPPTMRGWPAFRWLRLLLADAGIQLHDCFFTNFFVGLKADNARPVGHFPGARDAEYVARCRTFLLEEIRLQQPTLLLTLGQAILPFLADVEPLHRWSGMRTLPALDDQHAALLPNIHFAECPQHPTTVVALTHPTYWPKNVERRRYGGRAGAAAELALLQDAVGCSAYVATPAASAHNG